jgi:hypothetical protein
VRARTELWYAGDIPEILGAVVIVRQGNEDGLVGGMIKEVEAAYGVALETMKRTSSSFWSLKLFQILMPYQALEVRTEY